MLLIQFNNIQGTNAKKLQKKKKALNGIYRAE